VAGIERASGARAQNAPGGSTRRGFCRTTRDVDTSASGGIAGAQACARAYRSYATAGIISTGSFCICAGRFRIGDGSYAIAAVRGVTAAS
jgi:hypothetical protein